MSVEEITGEAQAPDAPPEPTRKLIAALQVSLDGLIEGPNGELDWIGSWEDSFELLPQIDTCVLGGAMYPGYEQYWLAVLADPDGPLPFTGQPPSLARSSTPASPTRRRTSSCRGPSSRPRGRRRGSCATWQTFER